MKRKQKMKRHFNPRVSALETYSGRVCRKVREGMRVSVAVVAVVAGISAASVKRFEAAEDLPLTSDADRYLGAICAIEEYRRRSETSYPAGEVAWC